MRFPDDLRQFVKRRALIGSVAIRLLIVIGGIVTTGVVKDGVIICGPPSQWATGTSWGGSVQEW